MIPFREQEGIRLVSEEKMREVYARMQTPVKLGKVMSMEGKYVDCCGVFSFENKWYMYFISIDKNCENSGYQTHLAASEDLVHWKVLGTVLPFDREARWDSLQKAGFPSFQDIRFGGSYALEKVNGWYYMSYLGANQYGYEPDPLYMGEARTKNPVDCGAFERFPQPILRPDDPDARRYECKTLYKSYLFRDEQCTTGYPYVNAYNAKDETDRERIYLAVSEDGEHWTRYGDAPIIDNSSEPGSVCKISGDPQIVRYGDMYVMFYFRYDIGKPGYDTFACSYDLQHWTKWTGKPLIESEYDWENMHAHKPWVLCVDGKVYHYYCAVNDKNERFIALAVSEE